MLAKARLKSNATDSNNNNSSASSIAGTLESDESLSLRNSAESSVLERIKNRIEEKDRVGSIAKLMGVKKSKKTKQTSKEDIDEDAEEVRRGRKQSTGNHAEDEDGSMLTSDSEEE